MHNKGNLPSFQLIEDSYKKNSLYNLFIGKEKQFLSPITSIPIDAEFIFNSWLLFLDKNENKEKLWKLYQNIIVKISENEDFSWFSVYYLSLLLAYHKQNKIDLNIQKFIDKIIANVLIHKLNLKKDFRWIGYKSTEYSLWDDFKININNLNKYYDFEFHLEEINQ